MNTIGRFILAASLIGGLSCQSRTSVPEAREAHGSGAMRFELASLEGDKIRPVDLGRELVLIDFWATWCGPCHLQADILAKLYPQMKARGVEFVAVSLGEPEEVVRDFVIERPFAYPVLVDPNDSVATEYGIYVLPTVVLLDRDGTVMYMHQGISTADRLLSAVDEILEGRRPASRL